VGDDTWFIGESMGLSILLWLSLVFRYGLCILLKRLWCELVWTVDGREWISHCCL